MRIADVGDVLLGNLKDAMAFSRQAYARGAHVPFDYDGDFNRALAPHLAAMRRNAIAGLGTEPSTAPQAHELV